MTSVEFPNIELNIPLLNAEARALADRLMLVMFNYTRQAMISYGAVATRQTFNSIQKRVVGNSSRQMERAIVANPALKFIISGRRRGAKMPVRRVGTGKRGGGIFEPLPEMLKWFRWAGIPREAWFPILRSIKRNGIPARNVPARAMREARATVHRQVQWTAVRITKGIVKVS